MHNETQPARKVVGIDFDNTIVDYGRLLHRFALAKDWISQATPFDKRCIRDQVRLLSNGETKWQQIQAILYTDGLQEAQPYPGVPTFLEFCRDTGIATHIVSHKTPRAAAAPEGPDLRKAAMEWLERNAFLGPHPLICRDHVFFEATRADKLNRIAELGCTHFIDDLLETFQEADFPPNVKKILFAPEPVEETGDWLVLATWKDIAAYFEAKGDGHE